MKKCLICLLCFAAMFARADYYAVICGISDYDGSVNDLDYCDDDAIGIRDALLTGGNWDASHITLLVDSQATEANIRNAISAWSNSLTASDTFLFFFSGHGGDDLPDYDGDEGGGRI